jgi:hypothetical protein
MNVQLLIDSLVRQTMVLIAQVATSSGTRAPLARVANQVFLNLVSEIESQGVGRKVVADMFGLALRSYQQKVQRLTESATDTGRTLWEAVFTFLGEREVASRSEILLRFARDDEAQVKSILRDLVDTGLVYRTGRGESAVYRVAPEEDLRKAAGARTAEETTALVWAHVYRNGPLTRETLAQQVTVSAQQLQGAIDRLEAEGRLTLEGSGEQALLTSPKILLELGSTAGWEAALLDHHQAIVAAVCSKLRNGRTRALPDDQVGGSTFSFDITAGHPAEARVLQLLQSTRQQLAKLWDEVAAYNDTHGRNHPTRRRVTFYCGQYVTEEEAPRTAN